MCAANKQHVAPGDEAADERQRNAMARRRRAICNASSLVWLSLVAATPVLVFHARPQLHLALRAATMLLLTLVVAIAALAIMRPLVAWMTRRFAPPRPLNHTP